MKISLICICVFLFCTLYWTFGTSLDLASAENADISSSVSSENVTATSGETVGELSEYNVISSEGNLEPSADFQTIIDEKYVTENSVKSAWQEYGFIESVSQNAGVSHDVAGIDSLTDSATIELQEKVEELSTVVLPATTTSLPVSPSQNNNTSVEENLIQEKAAYDSANEAVVDVSVSAEVQERSDLSEDSNSYNNNNNNNTQQTDAITTEVPSTEPKNNVTEEQKVDAHEDIPSFSEWTQKHLEEAEKKKEEVNSSVQNQHTNGKSGSGIKKRWKNYASPDCGAKIIAANPEAVSPGAVLSAHRDEYTLNTCTSRIWFIVELCEAIQAKKIEMANYELFSSTPRDFTISVSDRFPSRDWSSVGHFTAKDERDVQAFDLFPHLFGKYIRFEMHSHYGSEHYCPISLFRVYGTSEFEVLETENQLHSGSADEDDDEETLDEDDGEAPKNLFSSAKDAVISIVKKAAEVLGNKGNASTDIKEELNFTTVKYTPLINSCTTPSHLVVCNNCSELLYGNVFELLSCKSKVLVQLVSQPVIKNALYNSNICSTFGFEFYSKRTSVISNSNKSFVNSFFSMKYVAAMCNTVAVNECKVVLNVSHANTTAILSAQVIDKTTKTTKILEATISSESENIAKPLEIPSVSIAITDQPSTILTEVIKDASQIKPTKTLASEKDANLTEPPTTGTSLDNDSTVHPTTSMNLQSDPNDTDDKPRHQTVTPQMESVDVGTNDVPSDVETTTESSEGLDLDVLATELNGDSTFNLPSATVLPPSTPQGQKESVFLRLSNRIKALERNMSLSSQYLEELSRRYKKQVEEMQRLLDKTINTLTDENKKKDEKTQRLEDQLVTLTEAVESLVAERNSWMLTTYWIFLSGIVVLGALLFCRRNPESKQPRLEDGAKNIEVQRRKSVDVISHVTPTKKKRRSSEEALTGTGTYSHLMIDEVDQTQQKSKDKRRKKRKSLQQLQESSSITTLNEEAAEDGEVSSDKGFCFAPLSTSSQIWSRQSSVPTTLPVDWIDDTFRTRDMPYVLEESEHSALVPMSYTPVLNDNNEKVKENGTVIHSNSFTQTATDTRSKRMFSKQKNGNGKLKSGHKKSASFDESSGRELPSPHHTDTASLTNGIDDKSFEAPRKEKRNTFRKLFRNLTFK